MAAMPKQVEEAAELAEQLFERMNKGPDSAAPVEEEVVASEEEASTEEETQDESTSNEDEDSEEVEEETEDTVDISELAELKKFKARYLSLKGKYEAEVPRLHQKYNDLQQSVIERLEKAVVQKEVKEEPTAKTPDKLEQFKEEYGEDFVDTLKMLIQAEADAKIKSSLQPVQDQVLSVEETQIKAAQQSFMGYLDEKVEGNWRELWEGADPNFIEFLQKPDPSGLYTYGELVQRYNDNWDADRLSKIFNIYLEDTKPEPEPKKPEQPNPAKTAMVAPSRSNTHNIPKTDDKKIWTQDMIREFEKADRAGKYTTDESKNMWDDLLAAVAENRIR